MATRHSIRVGQYADTYCVVLDTHRLMASQQPNYLTSVCLVTAYVLLPPFSPSFLVLAPIPFWLPLNGGGAYFQKVGTAKGKRKRQRRQNTTPAQSIYNADR